MNIIQYYDIIHGRYIISILYKYTGIYVIYLLVVYVGPIIYQEQRAK